MMIDILYIETEVSDTKRNKLCVFGCLSRRYFKPTEFKTELSIVYQLLLKFCKRKIKDQF